MKAASRQRAVRRFRRETPYVCVECGSTEDLTIDHVVPKHIGGTNSVANFQYLCHPCHDKKNEREKLDHRIEHSYMSAQNECAA